MRIKITRYLFMSFLLGTMQLAHAGLYRWTDMKGKVHYSDKIPQTIAQEGHVELNQNGTEKKIVISAEQRRKIKEAAERLKKQKKQKKILKKQQDLEDMRDIKLLSMFTSNEELVKVYQSKLDMTDESINLLKARHKFQSRRLEKLENKYEKIKNPQTREVMEKKIEDLLDNLSVYQQAITENYVEKEKLKQEFKINQQRFKVLIERQKQASR